MKNKLFNNLLLFSLFGIALGFFGMLYEGVVVIPKMLDPAPQRMQFWHHFYLVINPIIFYIPLLPIATIMLIVLYFTATKQKNDIKKQLGIAGVCQIAAMILTFYIVTKINLKFYFSNIEKYGDLIPFNTLLINILSVVRLLFSVISLFLVFKSYIKTQQLMIKI